jgi:hypothetical protein
MALAFGLRRGGCCFYFTGDDVILNVWRIVSLASVLVVLMATPYLADFGFRAFDCEVIPPRGVWPQTIFNVRHLISYAALLLLARFAFPQAGLSLIAACILALSMLVELEQALFQHGHCRLRDMVPNVVGVSCALAILGMGRWFVRRRGAA